MLRYKNYIILAPHIDDEVIGCGGYVLNNKNIANFYVVYFSSGSKKEKILPISDSFLA